MVHIEHNYIAMVIFNLKYIFLWLNFMIKEIKGGKEVIDRLQKAYGFSKRKDFGEYLGISPNTFSSWVKRQYFPGDYVAKCALETGARLQYLIYGEEPIFDEISDLKYFHTIKLENGKSFIYNSTPLFINLLPNLDSREAYNNVFAIVENNLTYFATKEVGNLTDGEYFVIVENSHLIRYITVLPAGKIRVDGGKFSFECDVNDIDIVGKLIFKMEKML